MPDVLDVLRTLPDAVTPGPAGADVAAADVARGHRALIRQRRRRIACSSAAVAVVAAAAVGASQLTQLGGSAPPAAAGSSATAQASRVRLVAYTGTQPAGFKVSTVPAGWQVASSSKSAFVVAPPGTVTTPDPPGHQIFLPGRIAVMLQGSSQLPGNVTVTKVTINGKEGLEGAPLRGTAPWRVVWLIFPDAAGHKILVQVPTSLGLTNDQIVRFAQGITVTSDAVAAAG